jgi:hypothetical protein
MGLLQMLPPFHMCSTVTLSVMLNTPRLIFSAKLVAAGVLALSACSPTYDWRSVRGADAPFVALFPAKPISYSRSVNLDGMQLVMTMTAAEVDGVTFAVGTAALPDPGKAQAALHAMKNALVKNIGGTIRHEKSTATPGGPIPAIEIQAIGAPGAAKERPRLLFARFTAKGQWVYQAVVIGREKAVPEDAVDTFFTSFKLD